MTGGGYTAKGQIASSRHLDALCIHSTTIFGKERSDHQADGVGDAGAAQRESFSDVSIDSGRQTGVYDRPGHRPSRKSAATIAWWCYLGQELRRKLDFRSRLLSKG